MNARGTVRRLAVARFASIAGTEAGQLALAVAVYLQTHSAAWLAGAMLASPVVIGLLTPISGWIADHVERRIVIVAAEAGAGGVYIALIFARRPVALVALTLLASAVNAPLRAALTAAVPNLVPSEELTWANGLLGATVNAAIIAGPAVGGALVARAGTGAVFALDAATFLASAAITARIPGPFSGPCRQGRPRAGAGFALIAADRCMVVLVAQSCLASFALGLVTLADLPLARSFGAGPVGYGLLTGVWSAGIIAGSRLAAPVVRATGERTAIAAGTAAMAGTVGAVALLPSFPAIVAIGALGGAGTGITFAPWLTLMQRRSDDQKRGTVMAAADSFGQFGSAIGMAAGARAVTALGAQHAYLFPSAVLAIATIAATCLKTSPDYPTQTQAAAGELARLLAPLGGIDRAAHLLRARADTGDQAAATELARLLARRGDIDGAAYLLRARADTGDQAAAARLADLLAWRGDIDGLSARADTGDHAAATELARLLARRGDIDGAAHLLRARAHTGD